MSGLDVQNIYKRFGAQPVLQGVSFQIPAGQISVLLGPSGCGKSTLLSLAAGLDTPDSGTITWDGRDLAGVPPHRRGFGLMFQEYALFPHLNVFENVAFGLRMAHKTPAEIARRVAETLALVGLGGLEQRDVLSLSGGEQQRAALARSLAPEPAFLMLDEPLGALDHSLRERLIVELGQILRQAQGLRRQTALYVTHDQDEAFALADEIILLNQGRIEQRGAPQEIYQQPASLFVARFLGLNNLLPAHVEGRSAVTTLGTLPLPGGEQGAAQGAAQGPVTLLLRPQAFTPGDQGPLVISGVLRQRSLRSGAWRVVLDCHGQDLTFDLPFGAPSPAPGERLTLSADPEQAVVVFQ